MLLRKTKLNTTEILISKALIVSYISPEKFLLVSNVFREYHEMEEEIKNTETFVEHII